MGFAPIILPVVAVDTFLLVVLWVNEGTPLSLVVKHIKVGILFKFANKVYRHLGL